MNALVTNICAGRRHRIQSDKKVKYRAASTRKRCSAPFSKDPERTTLGPPVSGRASGSASSRERQAGTALANSSRYTESISFAVASHEKRMERSSAAAPIRAAAAGSESTARIRSA
jgi:hypothetical protein